ncbi:MAG: hypothetical protein GQ542_16910, partial [Desulforhopalus sp.]|nr:hypothetical protein [Desulforhopalus sp.]
GGGLNHAGVMGLIPEVMITPKILNNWLTMGYGVDTFGYSRMVILDVDTQEGYRQGHVPGAHLLEDGDLRATRSNGISSNSFQVPTKSQMDDIVRRVNIDTDSIIIFTGSRMTSIGRAYFNFHYWGFPRQQLKVLNGTNATYAAAGFALQTENSSIQEPCQYSVCSTRGSHSFSAVRASFAEMISLLEDNDPATIIIDARTSAEYAGNPGSTLLNNEKNEYVVFEGHLRTAVNIDYKSLLIGESNTNQLLPKEDLLSALNKYNIDENKISYVYGKNGEDGSVLFLVLDAVLNWPVKIYDGSWNQWGQMAGIDPSSGGLLEKGSPWRTDTLGRSESITLNKPNGFRVDSRGHYNSFAKQADEINRHDSTICGGAAKDSGIGPIVPGY